MAIALVEVLEETLELTLNVKERRVREGDSDEYRGGRGVRTF